MTGQQSITRFKTGLVPANISTLNLILSKIDIRRSLPYIGKIVKYRYIEQCDRSLSSSSQYAANMTSTKLLIE